MKHINLICNHQSLIKFIILIDQYKYNQTKTIYIVTFTTYVQKKCSNKNDFAGRHLLTFESQKLSKLFWKKSGAGILTLQCNSYLSHVRSFFKISSNFLSLISSYPLLKRFFSTLSFL